MMRLSFGFLILDMVGSELYKLGVSGWVQVIRPSRGNILKMNPKAGNMENMFEDNLEDDF